MSEVQAGFREIEHTADWELQVWAPDLAALLEQAARGMYALAQARLEDGPRQAISLQVSGLDAESLLVAFLAELLYLSEQDGLGFDRFALRLSGYELHADLEGTPLASLGKEIKAVTYHNLVVRQTGQGLVVNIVFDV
ncbi:MAG: archease [Chloroflexota bacterium]